jgi:hypothetical protein
VKVHYKTGSGRLVFELEGPSVKDIFRLVAETQNVFEADSNCGCCKSPDIQFRVRTIDSNEYFDLYCEACCASLNFGQTKKGNSLFPKRRDGEGMMLVNRGWRVWRSFAGSKRTFSQEMTMKKRMDEFDGGNRPAATWCREGYLDRANGSSGLAALELPDLAFRFPARKRRQERRSQKQQFQ